MTDRFFVDTNIFVYARDASFPDKQAKAHEILAKLWQDRSGRLSLQVCSEYYVTVTRKLKPGLEPDSAWSDLEALRAWEPLATDFATLQRARETEVRYGLSWWDSMIVASACLAECTRILSEDLSGGQEYFGLRVVNPFL
jgi:predicted nucleic acid-binding protein